MVKKQSFLLTIRCATGFLCAALLFAGGIYAIEPNISSATNIPSQEDMVCGLWKKFFDSVHKKGNGFVSWQNCIDATCAYYEGKASVTFCETIKQIRNEKNSKSIAEVIKRLVQDNQCPSKINDIFKELSEAVVVHRINERQAMELLRDFVDASKQKEELRWKNFAPTMLTLIGDIKEYAALCNALESSKNSSSLIEVSCHLKKHLGILPPDFVAVCDKIGTFGMLSVLKKRV